MSQSDYSGIQAVILGLKNNGVANFSYTNAAYAADEVAGRDTFDITKGNNIPTKVGTDFNQTVLDRGARSQAASLPRNGVNHFFGRVSYNLNKLIDKVYELVPFIQTDLRKNSGEYDATAAYAIGDVCYRTTADGYIAWYKRTGKAGQAGVPVTDLTAWVGLSAATEAKQKIFEKTITISTEGPVTIDLATLALESTVEYKFIPMMVSDDSRYRSCFVSRTDADHILVSVWHQTEDGQMHNGAWNYIATGGAESSIVNEGEVGAMECDYDGGGHLESIAINLACFDAGEYVAP